MTRCRLLTLVLAGTLALAIAGASTATAQQADACPNGWPSSQDVVFSGGRDTGVPNRAGPDGCTIMDAIWGGAPFRTRSAMLASVGAATTRFRGAGLLSLVEEWRIVLVAWFAPLDAPGGRGTTEPPPPPPPPACRAGRVALTFDDGPSSFRPRTLEILRDTDVAATFFDVGERVDANPALTRYEEAAGHVVGYHTYRHEALTALSDAAIRQTLLEDDAALRRAGVADPEPILRPPYGAVDDRVRRDVAALGGTTVLWTGIEQGPLWPGTILDYVPSRTAAQIRDAALFSLSAGAILLLHDGPINSPAGAATVAALPEIIDGARARGFCFGTVARDGSVVARGLKDAGAIPRIRNPVPYNPLLYPGTPPQPYVIVSATPPSVAGAGG